MRLALLLCLAVAPLVCGADLKNEDTRSIQLALTARGATLTVRGVIAKSGAVMLVEAGQPAQLWLFVVSGAENRVRLVLDSWPFNADPVLETAGEHTAYLHSYSDYGIYQGSVKYIYDVAGSAPPQKIPYGIMALDSSTRENGKLRYGASFGAEGRAIITIEPGVGTALPKYMIAEGPARDYSYAAPTGFVAGNGEMAIVENKTPPGQQDRPSAISVTGQAFSPPLPTMEFYHRMLPDRQAPAEIWSNIGPFVLNGNTIWFASSFYDGEGLSGVGAIGTFDIPGRKYEMRYLPEMVDWSGSAMLLDGNDLWVGLVHHPEGADYSGGLLRYDTKTGAVKKYAIPDVIRTIDRMGDALYCGTSHGLYVVRGDEITQLRFEPDSQGKLVMVALLHAGR